MTRDERIQKQRLVKKIKRQRGFDTRCQIKSPRRDRSRWVTALVPESEIPWLEEEQKRISQPTQITEVVPGNFVLEYINSQKEQKS